MTPITNLCLGHASIGAYSCFMPATDALDSHGEGLCTTHFMFLKECLPNEAICLGDACRQMEWDESKEVGSWGPPNPNCYRCGGEGIDPGCRVPDTTIAGA